MFSFYELSFIKIEKFAIEEQEKGSKSWFNKYQVATAHLGHSFF